MAISFPLNPATNDTYTYGNKTWSYNGDIWVAQLPTSTLADLSVTTAKIADGAVTSDKLANGLAVPSQTDNSGKFLTTDGTSASWGTVTITPADGSITTEMLANSSVTVEKLSYGTSAVPLASGNTAQRPSSTAIAMRYNTAMKGVEVYNGTNWTLISGGPHFSVYANAGQSLSASATTKVSLQNKLFDSLGCFNETASPVVLNGLTVPSYSFMPFVPGYYQFNFSVRQSSATAEMVTQLAKNGIGVALGTDPSSNVFASTGSAMIYLNGTTDYASMLVYTSASVTVASRTATVNGTVYGIDTYFQGYLVKGI